MCMLNYVLPVVIPGVCVEVRMSVALEIKVDSVEQNQ